MKKYFFLFILVLFAAAPIFAEAQAINLKAIQQKIWTVKAQVETLKISVQNFLSKNKSQVAAVTAAVSVPASAPSTLSLSSLTSESAQPEETTPTHVSSPAPERGQDTPAQNPNITRLAFTTLPQIIGSGEDFTSKIITVQSQNSTGGLEKAGDTIHLSFNSTSPTGLFSGANDSNCSGDFGSSLNISIAKSSANKNFCYKDTTQGKPTITVSARDYSDWTPAVQNIEIVNGKRGDVNKDGCIDKKDFDAIDKGFSDQNNPDFVATWENGDMNGDGKINFDDYYIINSAFLENTSNCPAAPSIQ